MSTDLTPDQQTFIGTTRAFLDKTVSSSTLREFADGDGHFDRAWWSQAAELGWTAMMVPESLGGGSVSGAPHVELALVAEELGRRCAPGPLISTSAVLTSLVRAGDRLADEIEGIVSGELVATWAHYAPDREWADSLDGVTATATSGGVYTLDGVRDRVEAGDQADLFLVETASASGPLQVLLTRDTPGLRVEPTWSLDPVRRFSKLELSGVRVDAATVVHSGPAAASAAEAQLHVAATLAAAETAGAVASMFDVTLAWMFDRYTFGRPLASYQALKHRMADNKTWMEACLATSRAAAAALDAHADDAAELVSIAKAYVGQNAPVMLQDFVQLHGGLGVTWEHDLHFYLRRAITDRALYGTPVDHRQRIAGIVERNAA